MIILFLAGLLLMLVDGRSFIIDYQRDCYSKDGECYRYISGEMHYFRIPPGLWQDRLSKLKAAGFDTVQTYVPWNVHEPEEGVYSFEGIANVFKYMKMAQSLELNVILRPGPFLATEWDFGGFPPWLLKDRPDLHIRTNNTLFMTEVRRWYAKLLPALKPFLYSEGGPVIAVQVENEYGSNKPCGAAHFDYMHQLLSLYRNGLGEEIVLFTVDGDSHQLAKCGNIPGLYSTVNFGAGGSVEAHFAVQRKQEPRGPFVCSAFFSGWLDHWGAKFNKVGAHTVADSWNSILNFNNRTASVSMYMFHGGTNFGYMQGSRGERPALGVIGKMTSYDYDAPVSEAGDTTWKYHLIRNVTSKYNLVYDVPANTTKQRLGSVIMERDKDMMDLLTSGQGVFHSRYPMSMEDMGQNHGFVLYNTTIANSTGLPVELQLGLFGDRVYSLIDWDGLAVLDMTSRNRKKSTVLVWPPSVVYLLVEDNGHVNTGHVRYNSSAYYAKGLVSNVTVNGVIQENWTARPFHITTAPFGNLRTTVGGKGTMKGIEELIAQIPRPRRRSENKHYHRRSKYSGFQPGSYTGSIKGVTGDLFIDMTGWGKGVLFVGHGTKAYNLGRYWPKAGPQVTLFCPKEWTGGLNETTVFSVFELEQAPRYPSINIVDTPFLDGPYDPDQL